MHLTKLTFAISSFFVATQAFALDLTKETEAYKQFVIEEIDQLVASTEKFVSYLAK
ncbi:hypothetical protein [Mannheimia pernigra]|uniref:hypothetical protein n=1 Tax=Mannheimia pernigra TaxID=111844 RepID=UPI003369E6F6